jgi:hypothetical protein
MATDLDPIEGNWYEHLDKGYKFEIVAVDQDSRVVEIQHFDGDVEEIDLDTWYDLDIEGIETPEDWTGPVDDIERDDLGYTETEMESEDWSGSLGEVKKKKPERDNEAAESEDDWGEGYPKEEPWAGEE